MYLKCDSKKSSCTKKVPFSAFFWQNYKILCLGRVDKGGSKRSFKYLDKVTVLRYKLLELLYAFLFFYVRRQHVFVNTRRQFALYHRYVWRPKTFMESGADSASFLVWFAFLYGKCKGLLQALLAALDHRVFTVFHCIYSTLLFTLCFLSRFYPRQRFETCPRRTVLEKRRRGSLPVGQMDALSQLPDQTPFFMFHFRTPTKMTV